MFMTSLLPNPVLEKAVTELVGTITPSTLDAIVQSGLFSSVQLGLFATIIEEVMRRMSSGDTNFPAGRN